MDIASFANRIAFHDLQPDVPLDSHPGWSGLPPEVYRLREVENTALPERGDEIRERLQHVIDIPRMSTYAIAALINHAVGELPPGQSYVNVGVWQGYSLHAGMAGNPNVRCVGIDNFCAHEQPRDESLARFEQHRGPAHDFFVGDFQDYFNRVHEGPIGFYFYDADHSYEGQLEGLRLAERFLAPESWILVDDTNLDYTRQAALDFVAGSARRYETVLERSTPHNAHPTWWNGLTLLRSIPD